MLNRIVQYCENSSDCCRVQLLGYFGKRFQREDCDHTCDNCTSSSIVETQDVSHLACAALDIVENLYWDNITILDCTKLLLGDKLCKPTKVEPDRIEGYSIARGIHRGEIEQIIYYLIIENALKERNIINRHGFANQYLEVRTVLGDNVTC
jgi:bloom syndrome protein